VTDLSLLSEHDADVQLASLARLDLGEDWPRDVCWHNPAALFGVDAAG